MEIGCQGSAHVEGFPRRARFFCIHNSFLDPSPHALLFYVSGCFCTQLCFLEGLTDGAFRDQPRADFYDTSTCAIPLMVADFLCDIRMQCGDIDGTVSNYVYIRDLVAGLRLSPSMTLLMGTACAWKATRAAAELGRVHRDTFPFSVSGRAPLWCPKYVRVTASRVSTVWQDAGAFFACMCK